VRETLLAKALDALPNAVFLYDRDLRVHHANAAARRLGEEQELSEALLARRGGEVLRCVNSRLGPSGCGSSKACEQCLLRRSVGESLTTQTFVHAQIKLEREAPFGLETRHLRVLAAPFEHEGQMLALVEFVDVSELVELRALLPLCGVCGGDRTDAEYKGRVEDYLSAHPEAGEQAICKECLETHEAGRAGGT